MIPSITILEGDDLDQEQTFEAFMKGYFDHRLFIRNQLSEVKHIENLEQ